MECVKFKLQIFLILLFASIVLSAKNKLEPSYDSGDTYKPFKIGQSLTLQCKPKSSSDGQKIYWMKNKINVTEIASLGEGHYRTIASEGKFIIDKTREVDAGNYSCAIENSPLETYPFEAWANVVVKVQSSIQIKEGDRMELICIAKGTEPIISWSYKPEEVEKNNDLKDGKAEDNQNEDSKPVEYMDIESNENFLLLENDNVPNSLLVIKKVELDNRGYYKCKGNNRKMVENQIGEEDNSAESEAFVRVKHKMAALYPAIGIVAQIVVLAIVIIISEKRRNQNEVDESDTDEGPEKKEDSNFIRKGH